MAEGGAPLGDPTVDMDSDAVACLATFSAKFEKAYKTYKQKSADLHGISRFVKAEALKVISLERIDSNEAKKYTSTERERLIEASLQRINDRILRARDIMDNIFIIYEELHEDHMRVLAYENSMSLQHAATVSMSGTYMHRPLGFYTERASGIMERWQLLHSLMDRVLDRVNLRRIDTIQEFGNVVLLPYDFKELSDEYLLYSQYLKK